MSVALQKVLELTSQQTGIHLDRLALNSALDQDIGMSGDDVTGFAEALANEFGDQVWTWPWQRFACLDEGLSLLFPFILVWQLVSWPFRGTFEYPSRYERLELGHIAAVIEKGEWFEP